MDLDTSNNGLLTCNSSWQLTSVSPCILGGKIQLLQTTNLKKFLSEHDWDIIGNRDLHWTNYISKIVKTAEGVLASLSKTFVSCSPVIYLKLYMTLVYPHIEFVSPV
ncbi:Hypothetical predicted protein [Octopus vulgaris]|uniref:Uncharacterized protein n=1 Tax=Octopus vulgaris TaxID=6645 RepID=A0AA36EYV4_OCTVU|nr:Hypothetical predicted protein [Octopus vulgaris]